MKLRNCSQNLTTMNFSKFSKLNFSQLNISKVCFILGRANLVWRRHSWWNRLFLKIRFLIKKRKSYASFFLVLCLTPFVADITFNTLPLSQIYVCTSSYRLFNVPCRKLWHQQKGQHFFKIYVANVTKLIFNFTLDQVCFKLNKY